MFSGLTNQVSSWMGTVKGENEGDAAAAAAAPIDPAQSELATDAGEQAFENVPVGDDSEGAKATRYVFIRCASLNTENGAANQTIL